MGTSDTASYVIDQLKQLSQSLIESYYIMLLAIDAICGKHIILKSDNFIIEMHTAIKHLFKAQIVKHLHSCL